MVPSSHTRQTIRLLDTVVPWQDSDSNRCQHCGFNLSDHDSFVGYGIDRCHVIIVRAGYSKNFYA